VFGQNGFRPLGGVPLRMGQVAPAAPSAAAWWPTEGLSTVQAWDALIARVSQVANQGAQDEILKWVGRSDIPGSPAERYKVVADSLNTKFTPSTASDISELRKRLDSLETYKSDLEARVQNAEQSYGLLAASPGAVSTPEHDRTMQYVTGGIALLGLIVLPFVLD
jgi:hypothetical protein